MKKFPVLHSKPIYYQIDGTGRDSYINDNNGGLGAYKVKFREYRQQFANSLRQYDQNPYYLHRRNK